MVWQEVTFLGTLSPSSPSLYLTHPSPHLSLHPSRCSPDERPNIHPNCTAEEEKQYENLCSSIILGDKFKPCHSFLPPEAFLGNCVYDMCEYDGMQATLCDNVEAYAQACQSAGVTVDWRNNTFCRKLWGRWGVGGGRWRG